MGNVYEAIVFHLLDDGMLSFTLDVLGLEMRLFPDGRLRFFNPRSGKYLRTDREERERGDREQQRADRLGRRLQELGIDPDLVE